MAAKTDNFISPDYFNVDDLLTEEHKLIRESVRNYVKKRSRRSLKIMHSVQNFPSRS
jgi:glutaryl-CoA dehydrogenase